MSDASRSALDDASKMTALDRLAIARQHDFTQNQQRVYLAALDSVPAPDVAFVCAHLATLVPKTFETRMPIVGVILDGCRELAATRRREAELSKRLAWRETDEPTYRCPLCHDEPSGWALALQCPQTPCGRQKAHAPHSWARRCGCWLERHADTLTAGAQEAMQKGHQPSADYDALRTHHERPKAPQWP